jgi:hypothetical protein
VGAARLHRLRRSGTMAGRRRLKGEPAPTYGKCPRAVSLYSMLSVPDQFGGIVVGLVGLLDMLRFSA